MSWLERWRARRAEGDALGREFNESPPAVQHVGWGPRGFTRREKIRWARWARRVDEEMKLVREIED